MSKRLFVGGLSSEVTEYDLRTAFERFGTVESARIDIDPSGRRVGYGYIVMMEDAEAEQAILALDGSDLYGSYITVREARGRDGDHPHRGGGYR